MVLTHTATHDLPVLEVLLRFGHQIHWGLREREKGAALARRLRMGFTERDISRLHIPVGLDIGAESAEQMALAVVAELLMVRSGEIWSEHETGEMQALFLSRCGALPWGDADGWLFGEDSRACQTPTQIWQNFNPTSDSRR